MSASEHAGRSRRWLGEQLEQLGSLRNANPRDPSFKLWRQNTVTVLQRIWPAEPLRAERFRRIAFSPASPKADFRTMREWYVRGCADAVELLTALLTEVDAVGVAEPGTAAPAAQLPASAREDDFPVMELPTADGSATPSGGGSDLVLLDADGTAAALAPDEGGQVADDSGVPAPPTLHVEPRQAPAHQAAPESAPPKLPARNRQSRPAPVASAESVPTLPVLHVTPSERAATPPKLPRSAAGAPASRPAAASPPPAPAAPAGERRASPTDRRAPRPGKQRRAAAQPRLKDLLGLQDFGNLTPPAPVSPPAPEPPAAAPPMPPAPAAHVAAAPPAPTSQPPVAAPPPPAPQAPIAAVPQPPAPVAPIVAAAPPPVPERTIATPAPPPAVARPDGDDIAAEPAESDEIAQVTADFMRNSPVLGLQGRPVQRMGDATQFLDPDAIALASLAAEVGRHVTVEAQRDPLRVLLLGLAVQVEAKSPEWSSLRELVTAAMAHPELARRLMPLVLPWLGRAA